MGRICFNKDRNAKNNYPNPPTHTNNLIITFMYQAIYDEFEAHATLRAAAPRVLTALQARRAQEAHSQSNGFQRIALCRKALEALDTRGWQRSYHQKMFHETFMRACARVFWKTERPGQFSRDHQKILQCNGWDHLSQEILVSTPRRLVENIYFTKTRPPQAAAALKMRSLSSWLSTP